MEPKRAKSVENYIKKKQLTKKEFCKICKISIATLNRILNNDETVKVFSILKIINATELVLEDFYEPITKEEGKE
ncbi:MAG: helix-turn-helix domain-containing protein [Corallococcus sp.]|nr:helix-turn-helix domain-containing protein [Corallococcus sp.]MCM1359004.1 helix-turn-helix domain-containing protein [Corallococcus sp.]MCM1394993.1 helix-turn-helix domain-containing protein [Corallococcus sp.]